MLKKLNLFAILILVLSPVASVHAGGDGDCPMSGKAGKAECATMTKADCAGMKCELKSANHSNCAVDPNGRCRSCCRKSNAKTNFVPGNKKH